MRELKISSTSYDVDGGWKGVLFNRKGEEAIFDWLKKVKILNVWFEILENQE